MFLYTNDDEDDDDHHIMIIIIVIVINHEAIKESELVYVMNEKYISR